MNNQLFSQLRSWQHNGLAILRIVTGLLMVYHGWEVFDSNKMNEYSKWEVVKTLPAPLFMVYAGKALEFSSGALLALGLFTRTAALLMAVNMLFICFRIGNGKFYYEDQHPFIFAMMALVFFFAGPVKWSIDQLMFKPKNTYHSY